MGRRGRETILPVKRETESVVCEWGGVYCTESNRSTKV